MLWEAALVVLGLDWLVWSLAFIRPSRQAADRKQVALAPASRWGIVLVGCGFACLWAYVRPTGFHKSAPLLIASIVLGPPSVVLVWMATRHLGKQWRYAAALRADHELITTGPYRWLRHPIYASMLGMFLSTACCWTWWPLFLAGVVFFLAGTEIRIRAEDRLLAEHFGESFLAWRAHTRAYIPFLR